MTLLGKLACALGFHEWFLEAVGRLRCDRCGEFDGWS